VFDGIKRKVAASVVTSFLKSLATSKDTRTTIVGLIVGAVLALPGLDIEALISGDPNQVAKVAAGLGIWAIGFLTTKENADGKTTLVGTVTGALYASQGSVEAVITGVVIAVLGYFTNKQVAK
jgi:primosomal replication protein N